MYCFCCCFFLNNISAGHSSLLQVYRCHWTYVAITILYRWRQSPSIFYCDCCISSVTSVNLTKAAMASRNIVLKKNAKKKNNTRCFKSALQWSLDFSFLFREGRSSGIGDDMLPFHLYIRRRGIWVPQPLATTQAVSYTLSSTTTGKEGQNSKVSPWYPSSEEPLPYFKNRGMWRGWARLKNWGPRASGCIGKSASIKPSRTIK